MLRVGKKPCPIFYPRYLKKRPGFLHFISCNELSRMKNFFSLAVVGFVCVVSFAGAFSDDDLEAQNTALKEIAGDFADDVKLQNQKM